MASKVKERYLCQSCGHIHQQWVGRCAGCQDWNTLVLAVAQSKGYAGSATEAKPIALDAVACVAYTRIATGFDELDRALGGGLVPGGVCLIGGDPGIGKSTLLLQVLSALSATQSVLYVTGEESLAQVALRAKRLGLQKASFPLLAETDMAAILACLHQYKPTTIVIDSIQTLQTATCPAIPGSVGQVKASAQQLVQYAKQTNTAVILVGHVTKEGHLAGPRVLEHMVDTVLNFEGDNQGKYRLIRASKNRFGPVNELGIFAMLASGLKEVSNPSALFLSRPSAAISGSGVLVNWEGSRPLLIELQALVDTCSGSQPRRLAVGMDGARLAMLLAILNRHAGVETHGLDLFVNVVGGLKVQETAADLAVIATIVSSLKQRPLPSHMVVFGELGLGGEVRPVPHGQERIHAAVKQGFTQVMIPQGNLPPSEMAGVTLSPVSCLREALQILFP